MTRTSFVHKPALDGLRALAVAAVLLYHAPFGWAQGGFIGVDLFFVLSGYLITGLLLAEHDEHGRIGLGQFWFRRYRRLIPALLVVLLGVLVFAVAVADLTQLQQLWGDTVATVAYVANWRFVASSQGYFEQFLNPSPLRHMWSLAIEEQFYLLWPLVLVGLLAWKSHGRKAVAVVAGVGALTSAVLMALLYHPGDPSRAYYGTDTHAQGLLVGALIAVVLARRAERPLSPRSGRWAAAVGVIALVAFVAIVVVVPDQAPWMYRGGFLLVAAIGVGAVIGGLPGSALAGVLAWGPLRLIGAMSYGIYLWHWPVYLWLTPTRTGWPELPLFVVRLAVVGLLAWASYRLIEQPVRTDATRARRSLVLAPALAVLLVLAMAAVVDNRQVQEAAAAAGEGITVAIPSLQDRQASAGSSVPGTTPGVAPGGGGEAAPGGSSSSTSSTQPPPPTRVLWVGDSVAEGVGRGFTSEVQAANHLSVDNKAVIFCELSTGDRLVAGRVVRSAEHPCARWREAWTYVGQLGPPDLAVVQIGAWEIFDRVIEGVPQPVTWGSKEYDAVFTQILEDATNALGSGGSHVVYLTSPYLNQQNGLQPTPAWTAAESGRIDHFNDLLRAHAAAHPHRVSIIEFGQLVCPTGPSCPPVINGRQVRYDGVHFAPWGREESPKFGNVLVAQWLAPQLRLLALDHPRSAPTTPPVAVAVPAAPSEPPAASPSSPAPAGNGPLPGVDTGAGPVAESR